jgi:hypothetical protein
MAVYNGEQFVAEAIESILNQTFSDFEFLIINDGSTDRTLHVVLSYQDPRIRVVNNDSNLGLTKCLNLGLSMACGQYIARQDADDVSHPARLERQIDFMRKNPDVTVLGTQAAYCRVGKKPEVLSPGKPTSALAVKFCTMFSPPNPVSHPTVMFHKYTIWNNYGGYDPNYSVAQDAELWCRVGMIHEVRNLPETLVTIRVHASSVSADTNHPRRKGHHSRWKRLRPEVMRQVLRRIDIPPQWGETWQDINDPTGSPDVSSVLNLLKGVNDLEQMFFDAYPEARGNQEIKFVTAEVKNDIALCLAKRKRMSSLFAFSQVFRSDPRIAIQYFPKFVALFMLGDSAKSLHKKFKAMRGLS